MSKHPRDNRPYIKPVTRLELPVSHEKLRWIAIALCLAIGMVALGYGFSSLLSTEPGWQEVSPIPEEINCAGDFVLMYDFSTGDINPTAANKKLEELYGDLTVSAYQLFYAQAEGADNLSHMNAHINETVTVAPELYAALAQVEASGSRQPFLAPVQKMYDAVFLSATEEEAALYDPAKNDELAQLCREMAEICGDPAMIWLELLGENQVRLTASQEYLTFARENEITTYFDFGWMTNAFIADYMAENLEAEGFCAGYLASYDGFTRNLFDGESFSQNIYHFTDGVVTIPGVLEYEGAASLVSLRSYPLVEQDCWRYYAYADGSITSVYLNPADGMPRTSIDGITAYSQEMSCAEILLKVAPVFLADAFDARKLEFLAEEGIDSIRCSGKEIVCTEHEPSVTIQDSGYALAYSYSK